MTLRNLLYLQVSQRYLLGFLPLWGDVNRRDWAALFNQLLPFEGVLDGVESIE